MAQQSHVLLNVDGKVSTSPPAAGCMTNVEDLYFCRSYSIENQVVQAGSDQDKNVRLVGLAALFGIVTKPPSEV